MVHIISSERNEDGLKKILLKMYRLLVYVGLYVREGEEIHICGYHSVEQNSFVIKVNEIINFMLSSGSRTDKSMCELGG